MRTNGRKPRTTSDVGQDATGVYEVLTAAELAERLRVKSNTIREYLRTRCPDPIPHLRMGRSPLFEWDSPWLADWLARRRRNGLTHGTVSAPMVTADKVERGRVQKRRRKK